MSKRLDPKTRKKQVLEAAIKLSERFGYMNIRREDVAREVGVSPALVSHIFGTVPQLKRAVMRHAVRTENYVIILQGLSINDKQALKAPPAVRVAAYRSIGG